MQEQRREPENQPTNTQLPLCAEFLASLFEEQKKNKEKIPAFNIQEPSFSPKIKQEQQSTPQKQRKSTKKVKKQQELQLHDIFLKKEQPLQKSTKNYTPQLCKLVNQIKTEACSDKHYSQDEGLVYAYLISKNTSLVQKRPKKLKKKQIYMPTVISSLRSEPKKPQNAGAQSQSSLKTKEELAEQAKEIKKIQILKKKVKQRIQELDQEETKSQLTEQQSRGIRKEKKKLYSKLLNYDRLLAKQRSKKTNNQQVKKQQNAQNAPKTNSEATKPQKKPQTQYQIYMQKETEKKAKAKRLLQQQQLTIQKKRKFEEQMKKSTNPVHSVSHLQDQMKRRGLEQIKKLHQQYNNVRPKPAKNHKTKKQVKQKPKVKEQTEPAESSSQSNASSEMKEQKLSSWRRQLMKITRYNPNSQVYRERDREVIRESGFQQIEREDRISRQKARKEQRQAELKGEIDEA